MVHEEVAAGEDDAYPAQPCHAEDAAVEEEDREFDEGHAPRVHEEESEMDL